MTSDLHNPFVGPRPLEEGAALYGRDTEVTELFHLLRARRVVLLHSPSGAGKSSLLQAGLIPRLREARYDVWRPIRVNFDPGALDLPEGTNRYLLSTLLSLEGERPVERQRAAADLAGTDLATYVDTRPRRRGFSGRPVVLIFDQFEEILTTAPGALEEKRAFFGALGQALDETEHFALFSIREDYLGAFAPYRDRVPTHLSNTFRLDLLDREHATEVAVRAAAEGGRSFPAAARLVEELSMVDVKHLDDTTHREVGPYVEPVQLQVVCRRVWDAMPASDLSIDADDLARHGDVREALAGYYADTVAAVAERDVATERTIREWVGLHLVSGGVRTPVRREAGPSKGLDNARIEGLVDRFLVRTEQRGGAWWYELSHDRLVEPVLRDNERWEKAHLQPFQVQARLWEQRRRSPDLLLTEGALAGATAWAAENPAVVKADEREYLAISQRTRDAERRQRRRSRMVTVVLASLLVLAVGAMGVAWVSKGEADASAARARDARALVGARELLALGKPAAARLVLGEVSDRRSRALAQLTFDAESAPGNLVAVLPHAESVTDAAWSPDAARIATVSADGVPRVWNVDGTGETTGTTAGHSQRGVWSVSWSANGTHLLTFSPESAPTVWRADLADAPVVLGRDDGVVSAEWTPDNARILAAYRDGTVRLWRADGTGEPRIVGAPGGESSATLSPDGARILTVSAAGDQPVRVWETEVEREPLVLGPSDWARGASWSPDGRSFLGSHSQMGYGVWSLDKPGYSLRTAQERSLAAAWSPDGSSVLVVGADGSVAVLVPARAGPEFYVPQSCRAASASWSPEGQRILSICQDGGASLWRLYDERDPVTLRGHLGRIYSASFSPDGRSIVAASEDGTARVWRADMGSDRVSLPRAFTSWSTSWSPVWSPDGTRLLRPAAGNRVEVLNSDGTGPPIELSGNEGPVRAAAWSPDGAFVVSASDDHTARVWRADGQGEPVPLIGHADAVVAVAWSPGGARIVTASMDGTARVWSPSGTTTPIVLDGQDGPLRSASWSPDGTRVVTVARDGTAHIWRADGTDASGRLGGHDRPVWSATWSPDGRYLVAPSRMGIVRLWRTDTLGEPLELSARWERGTVTVTASGTFPAPPARLPVTEVGPREGTRQGADTVASLLPTASWHPDGTRFATSDGDGSAWVWTVDTERADDLSVRLTSVYSSKCTDSDRVIATVGPNATQEWSSTRLCSPGEAGVGAALVWRSAGLRRSGDLSVFPGATYSAVWSPDGARIAGTSLEGSARVWLADGGGEPVVLKDTEVRYTVWSPDGTRLVTASPGGNATIWPLSFPAPHLCLSPNQREVYLVEDPAEARTEHEACERTHGRIPRDNPADI